MVVEKAGEIIPYVVRVEARRRDGSGSRSSSRRTARMRRTGGPRRDGVDFRCRTRRRPAPRSSRSGSATSPIATPWTSTAWAKTDRPARRRPAWSASWPISTGSTCRRLSSWSGWARNRRRTCSRPSRRAKHRSLDRLLTGLAIRHVGTRMAEVLAQRLKTLEKLRTPRSLTSNRRPRSDRLWPRASTILPGSRPPAGSR